MINTMWKPPEPGSFIIAHTKDPKEKFWGILISLDGAGVWMRGLDLRSFEDWARQIASKEERTIGLTTSFVPMMRVERILLDRPCGAVPSLDQIFQRITGRWLRECPDALEEESHDDGFRG